jgi:hypothetical protein
LRQQHVRNRTPCKSLSFIDVNSPKVLELEVVDAKIRAGERLVAEQELRIGRLRTLGIDESPSMKLLQQFNLSPDLLTIILRKITTVSDSDVIDLAGPNRAPGVLARLDSPT